MNEILMKFRGYTFGRVQRQGDFFRLTYKVITPKGHNDWPVFGGYPGRVVKYDKPELIPEYIQKEIKRIYYAV